MTVFIEYVLIDNFVIDYMLLKATFAVTGYPYSKGRLFLCAFLGSIFALFYPLLPISGVLLSAIKILFGMILVLIPAKLKSIKRYYIMLAVFLLLTFLLGGAIMGTYLLFGVKNSSEFLVTTVFIPAYLLIKCIVNVVKSLYKQKDVKALQRTVEICFGDLKLKGIGFFDTGNGLFDGENPVIVCSKNFAKQIFCRVDLLKCAKQLAFKTVSGESKMLSFSLDNIVIYNEDKVNIFSNVTLCVAKGGVGVGYDVILHPALMEDDYDKCDNKQIKKVS